MNLPLFIARRTAKSTTSTQSTMVRIAISAVAVSIAVMVVTVAIVAGFRKQIVKTISDLSAEITLTDLSTLYGAESKAISRSENLENIFAMTEGIASIDNYAIAGSVIRSQSGASGVLIKGTTKFDDNSTVAQSLKKGALPRIEESRYKELLISEQTAEELGVDIGSRVEVIILSDNKLPSRELFKICGIYSAVGDIASAAVLTDIRNVQRLNCWDYNTFSGFEISVADGYTPEDVAESLNWNIFKHFEGTESLTAVPASSLYANIFNWMATHDINAVVIIVIMFIVALFNMVTALLILLFERTRMVGILKSMGMNNRSIRSVFIYQAAKIVGWGMAIGNGVAILLIIIQKYTGVIKLDASAYFVSEVPVSIGIFELLTINTIFALVILSLLFTVTAIVSRIESAEAVKYE